MNDQGIDLDMPVEEFLEQAFEDNYQALRLEEGRALAPNLVDLARQQVLLYWKKLADVAQTITDTEVRLALPNQTSSAGRQFSIEGVVDIVRETGYTVMYDIKALDAAYVRDNAEWFENQLNVYAHIWQNLRGETLRQTAIIATAFPGIVEEALASGDPGQLAWALGQWSPIVPLAFRPERVEEVIREFGATVDAIEERRFAPRPSEELNQRGGNVRVRFAIDVCNECDARFSCSSYRAWAAQTTGRAARLMQDYFLDDEAWVESSLVATPDAGGLVEDFVER